MPWKDATVMSQRREFVLLALQDGSNIQSLCRGFGISRKTGYKWLRRFSTEGEHGLLDRSRRPHSSPLQTDQEMEAEVLSVRDAHPAWGGRKIRQRLVDLGHINPVAASTITEILRRHGRLEAEESAKRRHFQRFEHEEPNQLWQMDFKGHFGLSGGGRCHPLTVIDDHSRYAVCVHACGDQRKETVQSVLVEVFRRYGLPERMLMDNGSCWGHSLESRFTPLSAWLIRLGVRISHGRPYHPQTQGKNERFNRTLKEEVIQRRSFRDLNHCQQHFDRWRPLYNFERPHEALDLKPPITRYHSSNRQFPETLLSIEYDASTIVRMVKNNGEIRYAGKEFGVGKAFAGYPVALHQTATDHLLTVYFCEQQVATVDLRDGRRYKKRVCKNDSSPMGEESSSDH